MVQMVFQRLGFPHGKQDCRPFREPNEQVKGRVAR
jgi:hypothetical protein